MVRDSKTGASVRGRPRCPTCDGVLGLDLVEVRDEADGDGELLVLLDCPRGDFHAALTHRDLAGAAADAVIKRLHG